MDPIQQINQTGSNPGATAPSGGRPIMRNTGDQVAVLEFLEKLEGFKRDRNGEIIAGEFYEDMLEKLPGLLGKQVSLANKDINNEYTTTQQIENILLTVIDLDTEENWNTEKKARESYLKLENTVKTAYDLESRNQDGEERKMLQTSIHSHLSTSSLSSYEGQIKNSKLGKLRKLLEL